ncbi:MAG: bifunctional hydroxymethylpyrimidine kinase/phosphomethylpyrimidine kinase [Anaerolineae bacterium]|nr:bifunctional hydroxymethylpyrimidine kinase/phosphomethylpyrimidine kinase [Anaerolineae bacterium]
MNRSYYRALTIAGSDSGGGAGIQADLKTFSALGCYGMSVLTALTAQNTVAVTGIHPVPPQFIAQQIDAVMQDIGVDAVKIGMLHSSEVIRTVAERLAHYRVGRIVVDPVMVAKSGAKLLQDEAVEALREVLLPLATVITPNLPEAAVLLERPISDLAEMQEACRALAELGPQAVYLKGGHLGGKQSPDVLYVREDRSLRVLKAPRVETRNVHGTGCTLSSAIAAYLAQGYSVRQAVERAKAYMTAALRAGAAYRLGQGHGPVHHFHRYWR